MDPLSVLREYTMRGDLDKIVRVNTEFRFGSDYSFPCSAETAYRSNKGSLFTLETLVYYIQNAHLKHTDYFQSCRALGIPAITFVERKPLLDYLTGKLANSDAVVFPPFHQQQLPQPQQQDQNPTSDRNLGHDYYRPEEGALVDSVNDAVYTGENGKAEQDYLSLIYSTEKPLKDRESLLECKNKDFYSVLVSSTKREEERQRIESQQRKDGLVSKSRLMGGADDRGAGYGDDMPKLRGKTGEGVPIILVPSAFQTLITIYNVKEFLEDGVYVPTDVKVKQMKGAKPECVTVQKKFSTDRNRVMTAYEVRDKPSSLKSDDWDRVVAVFVLGKEWQFKDWPFKDHLEIFNKIVGFFVRFEDDSIESAKTVKQWNVKIISISKNKRHQDRTAALEVWNRLEEFVRSRSHS
ncbi:Protein CDC73 homolog [Linum grandiflorum]